MKGKILISFLLTAVLFSCISLKKTVKVDSKDEFIKISTKNPEYFETTNGHPWVPIMINFLPPDGKPEKVFKTIESYFKNFSENGGNAMRVWISASFLEIEDEKSGYYNPIKFERIDSLLQLAAKYRIKIKFTLQHIRTIGTNNSWSNSQVLAIENKGPFKNILEYINTTEGKKYYLNRARALSERYKNNGQIYGWELWNEMDAVDYNDWLPFTCEILDSVKAMFPNQLVTQTLSSLHSEDAAQRYKKLFVLPQNDFISLHRYLDPGKKWNQYNKTTLPIDQLIYDAMKFAQSHVSNKPIIINEIGAVEANHAGPSHLYPLDTAGVLIHDMIFAPFFCGAAGCGSMWHWDSYVMRQNLWYHYKRFENCIQGIDPVAERFISFTINKNGVRCYGLKGLAKTIIWCRDTSNNWNTELLQQIPATSKNNFSLSISEISNKNFTSAKIYDPWKNVWTILKIKNGQVKFPTFLRSVILIIE